MTEYQLQAMSRTGETGEVPLRNAAPGSSGGGSLSNKQIDAAVKAWFAIDDTDHEPSFRERMRAATAAAGDRA